MLKLFYDEPEGDRWLPFDRHPRRIVRRILRGKPLIWGHRRIFLNLCAGLDRIGVPYSVNDYRWAKHNPAALACGQQACGAVVAVVISLLFEPESTWNQTSTVWVLLAVVGVICSAVPTALYLRLLARAASLPASLVAYLQPVWATMFGWTVLGEPIRAVALLGTAIVVAGIALTTRRPTS